MDPDGAPLTTVANVERRTGTRAALVATVLAVGGGGAFATYSALASPAGPSSPEEAVDAFFVAADGEDVLGMLELVAPAEREAYVEPALDTFGHLQRLGVLAEEDLSAVTTFDVEVDGLRYTVETLEEDLSWVTLVDGTITTTSSGRSPLGSAVTERVEGAGQVPVTTEVETIDPGDDASFAVVRQDGGWYLSATYTIAERARRDAGLGLPNFDAAPLPVGAASPEAAVAELVAEAVDADLTGVLTRLDPREFAALYDYSPLVIDRAQRELDTAVGELRDQGYRWSVEMASTRTEERNGRTVVLVDGIDAEFTGPDLTVSMTYAEGCSTMSFSDAWTEDSIVSCADDPVDERLDGLGDGLGSELGDLALFEALEGYEAGVTVVERDGVWFVAGGPSYLGAVNDLLALLEPADVAEAIDWGSEALESWGEDPFGLWSGTGTGIDTGTGFVPVEELEAPTTTSTPPTTVLGDESMTTTAPQALGGDDQPTSTTSGLAAEFPLDLPAEFEVWAQQPDSWWLGWLYDLPEPEAVATVWLGDAYVDVAVMAPGGGADAYAVLSGDETFPLVPAELPGIDPSVVVLADETQIIVVVGDHVLSGFPEVSEEALVTLTALLLAQG